MPEFATESWHETSDVSARAIVWFALSLAASLVIVFGLVWWMWAALDHHHAFWPRHSAVTMPGMKPPAPALQISPADDLRELRQAEEAALHGYGWIDRSSGVIHIPVDRAMDLILQRGLPQTGKTMPPPGPQPIPGKEAAP
ncbi:MAG TPA: hypothetical protein VGH65_05955 [Verrucomicrobiaceae bacterium]|jgi:hypothetical protein